MTVTFAEAAKQGNGLGGLVILPLIALAFYFVAVRPGRRRVQAMQAVQRSLEPGRRVVTTAGLYGTVAGIDDEAGTLDLEIAPGVTATFARGAVLKVVDAEPAEPLPADAE